MRKSLAPIALTAALAGGVGALAFAPAFAGAQTDTITEESTAETKGRLAEVLAGLVDDGTITQAQAEAVAERLREAHPRGGDRHPLIRATGQEVLEYLDLTAAELREALQSGQTLAEVAESQDRSVDELVAVLVAAQTEAIDQAVANGRISEEQAARIKASLEERTRERVESGRPARPFAQGRGAHPFFADKNADTARPNA